MKALNVLKTIFITILLLSCAGSSHGQYTARKERNVTSLAKLYGYVRYFYPSDEVQDIQWNTFLLYATKTVIDAPDDATLVGSLRALFGPMAPAVTVYEDGQRRPFDKSAITPSDTTGYTSVTWQYLGLETPYVMANATVSPYRSIRLNRHGDQPLFAEHARPGEIFEGQLVKGISCMVPLSLYGTKDYTYPRADTARLHVLLGRVTDEYRSQNNAPQLLYVRLPILITAWNIYRHYFPYWDDASKTPETVLHEAIVKTFSDVTDYDFLKTLRLMCAALNDGHMYTTYLKDTTQTNSAPIILTVAEQLVVVEKVLDSALGRRLHPGDIVDSIDGIAAPRALRESERYVSGSAQWKEYQALIDLSNGPKNSTMRLGITGRKGPKEILVPRSLPGVSYRGGNEGEPSRPDGEISPGIFYFNLTRNPAGLEERLNRLNNAKALIFDYRGYPSADYRFIIDRLMARPDTSEYMFAPQIIYPDYQRVTYLTGGWHPSPASPHLEPKVYFLTDASIVSSADGFMGIVKDFRLATLVGGPTAGYNGNINFFNAIWYQMAFTGMRVANHDGSKHHLTGVVPQVIVHPTVKGIREGRDETLERAIELANSR